MGSELHRGTHPIGRFQWPPPGSGRRALCGASQLGQIGRIDLRDGGASVVSTSGGDLIGPDDLAFDSHGNLFITEVMGSRVRMRRPNGVLQTLVEDSPCANGITIHDDRIFMSEFTPGGRTMELSPDGAAPRVIASNQMMPNALQLGPDGLLYFPLVPLGEIWRVALDGKQLERVTGGLVMPTAVKFDPAGRLWAVEAATGAVRRIDLTNGAHVETVQVAAGADNFVFRADGTMFVSHFADGEIVEVSPGGSVREVVPAGPRPLRARRRRQWTYHRGRRVERRQHCPWRNDQTPLDHGRGRRAGVGPRDRHCGGRQPPADQLRRPTRAVQARSRQRVPGFGPRPGDGCRLR